MIWLRTSPRQIRTEDDRYIVQRDGEAGPYWAWGPKGSQDVSRILPRADYRRGRALIGKFPSGADARAACEAHDTNVA